MGKKRLCRIIQNGSHCENHSRLKMNDDDDGGSDGDV